MKTLDNTYFYHQKNLLCSIGMIYKNPVLIHSYEVGIYFMNAIVNEKITTGSFQEKKFNCSEALFFVAGHVWKKNKDVIQNIKNGYQRKDIAIPANYESNNVNFYRLLNIQENEIHKYHQDLLNLGVFIPMSAMYSYNIEINHNGVSYIIPCSELARKYFFKSSSITQHVIHNTLVYNAGIISIEIINNERVGKFWVNKQFSKEEIDELAPIILDEAMYKACTVFSDQIHERFMGKDKNGNPKRNAYYKAKIPCDKAFNMEVCGKSFAFKGKDYFLVYQILSEDSEKHLPYDRYEAIRKEENKSTITDDDQSNTIKNTNIKFKDSLRENANLVITSDSKGNSRSIENKFSLEIDSTSTFEVARPKGQIIIEKKQDTEYSGNSLIINRKVDEFSLSDITSADSKQGRLKVLIKEIVTAKEEFLLMLQTLELLKEEKFEIHIYDFENGKEARVFDSYNSERISALKYIFVSIKYKDYTFYLLSFNDIEKDTRDVIIYSDIPKNTASFSQLEKIKHYISSRNKMPTKQRFDNWKKMVINKNYNLSGFTIFRMNNTQNTPGNQKEKLIHIFNGLIKWIGVSNY